MTTQLSVGPTGSLGTYRKQFDGISKLSDEQILQISAQKTQEDVNKSKTAKLYKALPAMVAATLMGISAVSQPGKLSNKMRAGAATGGYLVGANLILNTAGKIWNKLKEQKNNTSENKKDKMNPFIKVALQVAGSIGVIVAGFYAIAKGKQGLVKTFPKTAENLTKFGKDVAEKLNKSKAQNLVQNVSNKYQGFITKHPSFKNVAANAFPATLLAYFVASFGLSSKLNEKANENFTQNVSTLSDLRAQAGIASNLIDENKENYTPKSDKELDAICEEVETIQNDNKVLSTGEVISTEE